MPGFDEIDEMRCTSLAAAVFTVARGYPVVEFSLYSFPAG